ncbi:MAG: glycosyltransferase family 4 protein [Chloroflexota bacterium]
MNQSALRIGYIMQADAVDMSATSGPQLHVKAVVEGLKQRGHDVRLVAIQGGRTLWTDDLVNWQPGVYGLSMSPQFRIPERLVRRLQSELRLPFIRIFDSYRFSDACVSALKGFDVLYERFGLMSYGGLIAAKRLGVPIVYEVNGDLIAEWFTQGIRLSRVQWAAIRYISGQMLKRADCVITVSEKLKKQTISRWNVDPSKVRAIPNGADVGLFKAASGADPGLLGRVTSRYPLNGGPMITFVGGFYPWHGIDLLLDAFCLVSGVNHTAKLLLVGDGPVRQEMESMAESLGIRDQVIFTGMIPHEEVAALLSVSDIAVVNPRSSAPTRSQSPLKLFEYMAAGKAIVAPATVEMNAILSDGVNGYLVPPDDRAALGQALLELLADAQLRSKLGQAAEQQAIARHSWDSTVADLETVLHGLVPRPVP